MGFKLFTKFKTRKITPFLDILSYTDIGRHINKLINVS